MKKKLIKIAVLGYSNLDLLIDNLKQVSARYLPAFDFEFYHPQFGQLRQEVIDKNSRLYQFKADYCWYCDWFEDFYDPYFDENFKVEKIFKNYQQHLMLIQYFNLNYQGDLYINEPTMLAMELNGNDAHNVALQCRQRLLAMAHQVKNIKIINHHNIIRMTKPMDARLKFLARINIASRFSQLLAKHFIGLVAQALGKSIRLIVVDLDNTLWGGIVGEAGVVNINIGGDYPGNCFTALQQYLLKLKQHGILLAIASKNDPQLVEQVFTCRKMPLALTDFVAIEANWNRKSDNIRRIAKKVGFDYSNILFVDDSKIECAAVLAELPQVNILQLPTDVVDYFSALNNMPLLPNVTSSEHMIDRSNSYHQQQKYISDREKANNILSFYQSLNLKIYLNLMDENTINRCAELLAKTTQYNLTGRRYTIKELSNLQKNGHKVITISVEDIYSCKEIMGVVILLVSEREICYHIDNYVMSCRSLGKKAEEEALKAIIKMLEPNCKITGTIVPTARNLPTRSLFKNLGFHFNMKKSEWEYTSDRSMLPVLAPWARIIIDKQLAKKEKIWN